ncbi:MAG: fatty acid desaturase [Bdellovibrionales bacterium]|nr:fatty acid desaturase [Oligoflexia bacterium]
MKKETLENWGWGLGLGFAWVSSIWLIPQLIGANGIFSQAFVQHAAWKVAAIWVLMAHFTISAMSIAFHRSHTHQSIKLHPWVDMAMQTFLWGVTSMSKLDWVSVHVYHHTFSDTEKDPHSPKQKGLLRVFFLGAVDYSRAKGWPEVLKIRARIPANRYERFISEHLFTGPVVLSLLLMIAFGPGYGSILAVLNFSISPLFAVGGVNAIAHSYGYQNYESKDESRNIGFLFFLNWIICGELDHNNHHKFPKSPSFAHRWFEFDIGWVYIRMMRSLGLVQVPGKIPSFRAKVKSRGSQSEVAFVS